MADTPTNPNNEPLRPLHEAVRLAADRLMETPLEAVAKFEDEYEAEDDQGNTWT